MFKRFWYWVCRVLRIPNPKADKEAFDLAWEAYQAGFGKEDNCYD